jgi:hypothetical protein
MLASTKRLHVASTIGSDCFSSGRRPAFCCAPMASSSQKAAIRRHMATLLSLDWVARHEMVAYNLCHGRRMELWHLVVKEMSPADLLSGSNSGVRPGPVIALPDRRRRDGGDEPRPRRARRA